jgi:hypothetical protein
MTATAVPKPSFSVRIGTNVVGALLIVGVGLMMALANWPGLIKLAGFVTAALAFVAVENWKHPERMTAWTPFAGFVAVPAAALVAVFWVFALPGERVLTVAIIAGASLVYCAASLLAWRYAPRSR